MKLNLKELGLFFLPCVLLFPLESVSKEQVNLLTILGLLQTHCLVSWSLQIITLNFCRHSVGPSWLEVRMHYQESQS
jgi:hypothetical protein